MSKADLTAYFEARLQMRPGDVIAFAGKAPLSFLIVAWESGKLSHVAMVK